jgi:hypothetical protein
MSSNPVSDGLIFHGQAHLRYCIVSKKISVPLAQGFSKAVIFSARTRIHKYTKDGCEVFFCSRLFVCVFVSGKIVFVGIHITK